MLLKIYELIKRNRGEIGNGYCCRVIRWRKTFIVRVD